MPILSSESYGGNTVTGESFVSNVSGETEVPVVNVTASTYTPSINQQRLEVNAVGGSITITLPAGPAGPYTIVKVDGTANTVTITGTNGETVCNFFNYVLSVQGSYIKVLWNEVWSCSVINGGAGNNNPASLVDIVAYYSFNTDGTDDSVNSHNMTNAGAATIEAGKFSNAARGQNGATDYFLINEASAGDFNFGANNFTISFWLKLGAYNTGNKGIVCKGMFFGGECATWGLYHNGAALHLYVNGFAGFDLTGGSLSLSTWYHVVVRRSGNSWTLWVNNSQVASTTNSLTINATAPILGSLDFTVLASHGHVDGINGYIDDLGVWKGATHGAISDAEIAAIYNAGVGLPLIG